MYARAPGMRKIAFVTVGFVLGMFFWEWYAYTLCAHPAKHWVVVFHACFFLALWSYLQTMWTDPGTARCPAWQLWSEQRRFAGLAAEKLAKDDPERRAWQPGQATWCSECTAERPERAHHCSECGLCVLRMDHHCPWIGNCIGWQNHKYFLLTNWWTFWTCTVWLFTIREPSPLQAVDAFMSARGGAGPAVGALIALVFWAVTGGMYWHSLAMACRNMTTVEELLPGKNPYELRSATENVRQLVGTLDWRLLFPVEGRGRIAGTDFPVLSERVADGQGGYGYGSC